MHSGYFEVVVFRVTFALQADLYPTLPVFVCVVSLFEYLWVFYVAYWRGESDSRAIKKHNCPIHNLANGRGESDKRAIKKRNYAIITWLMGAVKAEKESSNLKHNTQSIIWLLESIRKLWTHFMCINSCVILWDLYLNKWSSMGRYTFIEFCMKKKTWFFSQVQWSLYFAPIVFRQPWFTQKVIILETWARASVCLLCCVPK